MRVAIGGQNQLVYLPTTLARELGFYREEGLDVELQDFPGGSKALVTSTRFPVVTGGIAAPLPSKTTKSGPRCSASSAPAGTFEVATAPASPPPQRRQPIVTTPATAAISR